MIEGVFISVLRYGYLIAPSFFLSKDENWFPKTFHMLIYRGEMYVFPLLWLYKQKERSFSIEC